MRRVQGIMGLGFLVRYVILFYFGVVGVVVGMRLGFELDLEFGFGIWLISDRMSLMGFWFVI